MVMNKKGKFVFKTFIAMIAVAIAVSLLAYAFYRVMHKTYYNQLKDTIDNEYLEGKDEIGAYYYEEFRIRDSNGEFRSMDSIDVDDHLGELEIKNNGAGFWGLCWYNITSPMFEFSKRRRYKWYDFTYSRTYSPFMVVARKTDMGYDVIGEFILGVALTSAYDYAVSETLQKISLGAKKFETYWHKVSSNIIRDITQDYIDYLLKEKHKGIVMYNDVARNSYGINENKKMSMLDSLVGGLGTEGFFSVNEYFELRYDENYERMGHHPFEIRTGSYGDYVYGESCVMTITQHLTIKDKGVLKREFEKYWMYALIGAELITMVVAIAVYRRKRIKQ